MMWEVERCDHYFVEVEAKTKKEAVITAIKTYLNLKKREKLASLVGNYDFGYTAQDLERMRADG